MWLGMAGLVGQFQEGVGYFVVVVAEDVAFVEEAAGDGFYTEGSDAVEVGFDGGLAFAGVLVQKRPGDGCCVDEGVVKELGVLAAGVFEDFLDVLGGG